MSPTSVNEALQSFSAFLADLPGSTAAHWRAQLDQASAILLNGDTVEAVRRIRACYGGMGSLTDLLIDQANENVPAGGDARLLNTALDQHREELWQALAGAT